jgi:S1-C subfamily serine protease
MKREKIGLIILCFFIMGSLIFPLEGNAQTKPGSSGFPPTADLAKKNVALKMEGFEFASGLRLDENGQPNCNGLELITSGGAGSGFIVKDDGTVVTNYHVARKSLKGKALFQDGSTYEIKNIKVYDPINNIAILKISAQRTFPTCALGDSEKTEPLDRVLAQTM